MKKEFFIFQLHFLPSRKIFRLTLRTNNLGTAVSIAELNAHAQGSFYMAENFNKVKQQYYIKRFKSQRFEVQCSPQINGSNLPLNSI